MKKIILIITLSFGLLGCAALNKGWNDDSIRIESQSQGNKAKDFITAVTGNAYAGMAGGALVGLGLLISKGWKKKE